MFAVGRRLLVLFAGVVLVVGVCLWLVLGLFSGGEGGSVGVVRVLFVDEVSSFVGSRYVDSVLGLLRGLGFNVTFVDSSNASVSVLSRELNGGYKLIILVTHGGVARVDGRSIVGLFTDEDYSPMKYVGLVEEGYLARGVPYLDRSRSVFVFTPKYIARFVSGVKGSVILAFGCKTLYNPSMAEAFIARGARVYVGWTGLVSVKENYVGLELFLKKFLAENATVNEAVSYVNEYLLEKGYGGSSLLYYYPPSAGGLRFRDILGASGGSG